MTEHDRPTTAELQDLSHKLEAFGEELPPSQRAVFRDLLVRAAGNPDEVVGFAGVDERVVSTGRHAENESATTASGLPSVPENAFYVMGVRLFYY